MAELNQADPNENVVQSTPVNRITAIHVATVAILAVSYSGYYFCRSNFSVALPLILAEQVRNGANMHAAQVRLGSIASFGVLAYALGKIPGGILADRFGGSKGLLGGMAGSILFTLLFVAGGGFPIFTLAWTGNRFAQSLGWPGLVKVTSRWFSYSTYGSVMAILSLSYLFGDAISRETMSVLLAHGMGWRGLFVTGAGLLGVLLIIGLLFLRESPASYGLPPAEENPLNLFANTDKTEREQPKTGVIFKRLLRSRAFWLVCLLSLGTTLLRETFNLWTPTYFTQAVGMTGAEAAEGSAIFPLFGGLSVLVAGFLSDIFGASGRSRILFGGLALTVVALAALAFTPLHVARFVPLALVALVAFLLIGPYSYLAGAMSLDFGGKDAGATASGMIDAIGYVGGILSGNGMAWLVVTYGWKALFLVLAFVAALSSAVAATVLYLQHREASAVAEP